jgi:hypothetical protein
VTYQTTIHRPAQYSKCATDRRNARIGAHLTKAILWGALMLAGLAVSADASFAQSAFKQSTRSRSGEPSQGLPPADQRGFLHKFAAAVVATGDATGSTAPLVEPAAGRARAGGGSPVINEPGSRRTAGAGVTGPSANTANSKPTGAVTRAESINRIANQFLRAWYSSAAGTNGREGVVLIFRKPDGSYTGELQPFTNEYVRATFAWNPAAVAIAHTHPNSSDPEPSRHDKKLADKFGVPIFTITQTGLYEYEPATKKTTKVMNGLDWANASNYPEGLITSL